MNNTKTVFKGKIFEVVQTTVMLNGKPRVRDLVIHSGGAAICVIMDHKILLVQQTRVGAGEKTLEIPAGMVEAGEDPKAAAMRELNEEAGLQAKELKLITSFWPTPGYDSEVIHVYRAIDPYSVKDKLPMDDGEDIETMWMDLEKAYQAVQDGTIRDGKTILAIYDSIIEERK